MSSVLDRLTESGSRWLAKRTTRRSFLGTAGKTTLVLAGGSAVSLAFAQQAEARVCGQSGVSPLCPTFDCTPPDFWGWCWYAGSSVCCADGGLKKICDCCRSNYPNVQGYCPTGSSVFCVVESCLEDPRVQRVALDRWWAATPWEIAIQRSAARIANGGAPNVVITVSEDPLFAAVATPVAAELGATLLLTPATSAPDELLNELRRLGTQKITVVGAAVSDDSVARLSTVASVERLGGSPGIAASSIEIARWMVARTSRREFVAVGAGSLSVALAGPVGGVAGLRRWPVLVSPDAVGAIRSEFGADSVVRWVGSEAGAPAAPTPADQVSAGTDAVLVSRELAQLAMSAEPAAQFRAAFVPATVGALGGAFCSPGSLVILTPGQSVDPALRDWIIERSARFASAEVGFAPSATIGTAATYSLQSALNGFMAHVLAGGDGQGLPVVPQPLEERPIGRARPRPPWPGRQPAPVVTRVKQK
jgi:hypothetical protein